MNKWRNSFHFSNLDDSGWPPKGVTVKHVTKQKNNIFFLFAMMWLSLVRVLYRFLGNEWLTMWFICNFYSYRAIKCCSRFTARLQRPDFGVRATRCEVFSACCCSLFSGLLTGYHTPCSGHRVDIDIDTEQSWMEESPRDFVWNSKKSLICAFRAFPRPDFNGVARKRRGGRYTEQRKRLDKLWPRLSLNSYNTNAGLCSCCCFSNH